MKNVQKLVFAVCPLLALSSCKRGEDSSSGKPNDMPQPVEVMAIEQRLLRETTGLVGSVAANEGVQLRAEYPGTVEAILFEEGQSVKAGDALVKLDTRELEAQLAELRANFQLAGRNLERNRSLLKERAVSQREVDASEAEHARLKAAIERLEVQFAKATISAPFDGVTGARSISVGDYVTPSTEITTVDDLSRLKVEVQVPERYLPLLQPGSSFQLKVATAKESKAIAGEVYFVSPRIDPLTRSTLVKGFIADPPSTIKPGMFANITLVLREVEDALVVPESALLSSPEGTVVIKPEGEPGEQVASFVPVKTGLRVPGWVQITPVGPPLKVGDKIVSAGVGGLILYPGRKVKLVEPVVTPDKPSEQVTDRDLK